MLTGHCWDCEQDRDEGHKAAGLFDRRVTTLKIKTAVSRTNGTSSSNTAPVLGPACSKRERSPPRTAAASARFPLMGAVKITARVKKRMRSIIAAMTL